MKARRGTAGRYAKALFMITRAAGTAEAAAGELELFEDAVRQSPDLMAVLQRPWVKPAERRAVAAAVAERAGCGPLVGNLVGLVAARGRIDHLREIGEEYRALVDEAAGRVRATGRSAIALTGEERRLLAAPTERAPGQRAP